MIYRIERNLHRDLTLYIKNDRGAVVIYMVVEKRAKNVVGVWRKIILKTKTLNSDVVWLVRKLKDTGK